MCFVQLDDRHNLYRIESDLGTEIAPIPSVIDPVLYVAPSSAEPESPRQPPPSRSSAPPPPQNVPPRPIADRITNEGGTDRSSPAGGLEGSEPTGQKRTNARPSTNGLRGSGMGQSRGQGGGRERGNQRGGKGGQSGQTPSGAPAGAPPVPHAPGAVN